MCWRHAELSYALYEKCQDAPRQFQNAGNHARRVQRLLNHFAEFCKRQDGILSRRKLENAIFTQILAELQRDLGVLERLVERKPIGTIAKMRYDYSEIVDVRDRLKEHQQVLNSHLSLFGFDIMINGNVVVDLPDVTKSKDEPQLFKLILRDWYRCAAGDDSGTGIENTVLYIREDASVRVISGELEYALGGQWHVEELSYDGETIYLYHEDPGYSE